MSSSFGYNEEGVTLRLKTETILFGKSHTPIFFLEHSQFRPGDKNILTQAQKLKKLPWIQRNLLFCKAKSLIITGIAPHLNLFIVWSSEISTETSEGLKLWGDGEEVDTGLSSFVDIIAAGLTLLFYKWKFHQASYKRRGECYL